MVEGREESPFPEEAPLAALPVRPARTSTAGVPGWILRTTGLLVVIGGSVTLVGWFANVPWLTDWDANGISMMPNAAVCAVSTGIALLLLSRGRLQAAGALGALVGLVGAATLFQHATDVDLGIDRVLTWREWGQDGTTAPGRMGLPGSTAWTLVGTSLALGALGVLGSTPYGRTMRLLASHCGAAVVAISLLSIIGYIFRARSFYAIPHLTTIALQTASMLLVVGIALVAAVPERGIAAAMARPDAGGVLIRRLLPAVILVPIVIGGLRALGESAGLYDSAFGSALRTLLEIGMLFGLLLWTASGLSRTGRALAERARLLDLTADAILIRDHENRILYWNRGATEAFGYADREALGRVTHELFKTELPEPKERIENELREKGYWQGEVLHTRKDGSCRTFLSRWVIDQTAHAEAARILESNTDVTGRKQAELERDRLLDSERAARTQAEEASRVKDEFLATLSHELRTPLNAILGWSEILARAPTEENLKQGVQTIARNARAQTDLIADLLDLSRITSGKLRLNLEHVDVADVLACAVDSIRPAAEAKAIRIQPMITPFLGPVRGDAGRLQQVVWNLLSNAVKFTPKNGRIEIALARKGSHVEIVVSDTGIGVKADFLPHLFERFRQSDASAARQHGGMGIGLTIVKHLVELHGGRVHAASAGEGQGATFTVELPVALTPAPVAVSSGDVRTGAGDDQVLLGGLKVLAVDDQEDSRHLFKRLLEERSALVVTAASSDEALLAVREHRPDVILCDIGMPVKDGLEFIRQLREQGDGTPALAVTAFARPEDRVQVLRAGYQGHIAKPVNAAELIATVAVFARTVADQAASRRQAP